MAKEYQEKSCLYYVVKLTTGALWHYPVDYLPHPRAYWCSLNILQVILFLKMNQILGQKIDFIFWFSSEPTHNLGCVVMLVSKPPSSNITWTTADCLNLKGALPICQFPIFQIKDALPESQGTAKLDYNERLGTNPICSLSLGFVINGSFFLK